MALAIDASTPVVAVQTSGTTATVTTVSFTPPSGSTLLVLYSANTIDPVTPSQPTITDSLGAHLTYSLSDWVSRADSPAADGQAAIWTAPVATGAAMTVTVTTGVASGGRHAALQVLVLTGAHATPVGAHGKSGSTSAASIAQSYTAQATSGWGFIAVADWNATGAETAGTGCTLIASANVGAPDYAYAFARRTTADDSNGSSNTLNLTLVSTSTSLKWAYVEIVPAAVTSSATPQPVVVAAPQTPARPQPPTVVRSTLADPPVLTTAQPLVITAPATRSNTTSPLLSRSSLVDAVAPAVVTPAPIVVTPPPARPVVGQPVIARGSLFDATTPGPLVVTAPPAIRPPSAPIVLRGALADDPVLTTQSPLVVTPASRAPVVSPPALARASLADVVQAATATPEPLVITSTARPGGGQALVVRSTLADPPVLTTPTALIVTIPARPAPATVLLSRSSLADVAPPAATPRPLVVTSPAVRQRATVLVLAGAATTVCDCTTHRPTAGITARPNTGTTLYPTAVTARPSSGTTARPNTGTTGRPCSC